jgi:hypothetical protein
VTYLFLRDMTSFGTNVYTFPYLILTVSYGGFHYIANRIRLNPVITTSFYAIPPFSVRYSVVLLIPQCWPWRILLGDDNTVLQRHRISFHDVTTECHNKESSFSYGWSRGNRRWIIPPRAEVTLLRVRFRSRLLQSCFWTAYRDVNKLGGKDTFMRVLLF